MQQLYDEAFVWLDPQKPTVETLEQFRIQVNAFRDEYLLLTSNLDDRTLKQFFGNFFSGILELLNEADKCINELKDTLKNTPPVIDSRLLKSLSRIYNDFNDAELALYMLRKTLNNETIQSLPPQKTSHTGLAVKISVLVLVGFVFLIVGIAFIPAAGSVLLSGALFLAKILGLMPLQAVFASASATLLPWMLGGVGAVITAIPLILVNTVIALREFIRNTWPKEPIEEPKYYDRLLKNAYKPEEVVDDLENDFELLPDTVMLNIPTPSWPKDKNQKPLPLEKITGNKSCYLLYQGHIYHATYPEYKNPWNYRACTQVDIADNEHTDAIEKFPKASKNKNYSLARIDAEQFKFFAVLPEKEMGSSELGSISNKGSINFN